MYKIGNKMSEKHIYLKYSRFHTLYKIPVSLRKLLYYPINFIKYTETNFIHPL